MIGLVLTAGGARGAYQAGVLKRIGEIPASPTGPSPFPIVAGASAGAINGAMIARAQRRLRAPPRARSPTCGRSSKCSTFPHRLLVARLRRGALAPRPRARRPPRRRRRRRAARRRAARGVPRIAISARGHRRRHPRRPPLRASPSPATSYHSGRSFTFVQGRPGHPVWMKSRRVVRCRSSSASTTCCASAAIPIVFPPVPIRSRRRARSTSATAGSAWSRRSAPRSGSARSASSRSASARRARRRGSPHAELGRRRRSPSTPIAAPPLAQICGVFLNAIFLDHLDTDLDHLKRMNELIAVVPRPTPRPAEAASERAARADAARRSPSRRARRKTSRWSRSAARTACRASSAT